MERERLDDQLAELETYCRAEGHTPKSVARAARWLKGRIQRLREATNDPHTLTWDLLGIDYCPAVPVAASGIRNTRLRLVDGGHPPAAGTGGRRYPAAAGGGNNM